MVLPSLLLILLATRLIGLLLRASTSTAQSVPISFTTRARWASTRGQQPSSFLFSRAHSGSTGTICVSFPPILVCRVPRAQGLTRLMTRCWCALGEQGRRIAAIPGLRLRRAQETNRPHVPPSFLPCAFLTKEAYSTTIESKAFLIVSAIFSFGP